MVRVLVACEESQRVTRRFRKSGIKAFSCDILPCSGKHPEWHLQQDVIPLLSQKWDMIIAFPPCTDLCVSGAKWFKEKQKDGRQQKAIEFFMRFVEAPCPRIAIENPIGIMSTQYRKPDQIIHPYMFGHPEKKSTCLWLKGVPLLEETKNVKEEMENLPKKLQNRMHYMGPSENRSRLRSKTYKGIAQAMADQWGKLLKK